MLCIIFKSSYIKRVNKMTYEETVELEKNVIIKNDADALYKKFKKYVKLDVSKFEHGRNRFIIDKDSNNATYLAICDDAFTYQCRFLHETYNMTVTPSQIFHCIQNKYQGLGHFRAWVEGLDRKSKESKNV